MRIIIAQYFRMIPFQPPTTMSAKGMENETEPVQQGGLTTPEVDELLTRVENLLKMDYAPGNVYAKVNHVSVITELFQEKIWMELKQGCKDGTF